MTGILAGCTVCVCGGGGGGGGGGVDNTCIAEDFKLNVPFLCVCETSKFLSPRGK